jgi:tetratricopeptide (TPR) repeat protein
MPKIMLITMIKNESKILKRMIDSALPILDAICILDTGSTDNTVQVANEIIKDSNIPGKVFSDTFVDFGTSRSKSFSYAKDFLRELEWSPNDTYGLLLDADMKLTLSPIFTKKMLGGFDSYKLKQVDATTYYNIRLIRMSFDWVCKGKTHEYWTVESDIARNEAIVEDEDLIWIDDVSDGGCKADKFERDERLLLQGIEEEPDLKSRYYFYLAQTYNCMKRYNDAISYYKKRIDAGGWTEEVWFSHFMICKVYVDMSLEENGKYEAEIEEWANKSFDFYKNRSDAFYITALYFYKRGNLEKCQEYIDKGKNTPLPEKELLFVEKSLYTHGYTSLQFQMYLDKKDMRCVSYGIKLMDKVSENLKSTILSVIIPYFEVVKTEDAKLLEIPEDCYNLSIHWDSETKNYNYLINDKVELLDESFENVGTTNTQIVHRFSYFFDKNAFVVPNERKIYVANKVTQSYDGVCYLGDGSLQTLYPFSTTLVPQPKKIEFLSYFKHSLTTSYNNSAYTLLYSNMSINDTKITVFYILKIKDGVIEQTFKPFTINNTFSSICGFTIVNDTNFTIIFNQNNKFFIINAECERT